MLIGILSDAHGNIHGLKRCLDILQKLKVHKVIYLGDALGYFTKARATCELLLQANAHCLMGNHEACFLGYLHITDEQEEVMQHKLCKNIPKKWLTMVEKNGPRYSFYAENKKILCIHATPQDPLQGRQFLPSSALTYEDFVFMGHSHRAKIQLSNEAKQGKITQYFNVGSCGYPRDYGSLLSLAVFDTEKLQTTIWRVPFVFNQDILKGVHTDVIATTQRTCKNFVGKEWNNYG